jgi:hypothetical protein
VSGYVMAFGAVVALARTGRWIVDRGTIDGGRLADTPDDLSAEEIARLTAETAAPGRPRAASQAGRADG